MITTTYLALVAVLGLIAWRVAVRARRRAAGRAHSGDAMGQWVRAALAGAPATDDDLVERMAACLVQHTTVFGSSYAIPGYLGAELPTGVFAAASAAKPQLTGEVLDCYQDKMVERARRLGRAEFALPADYVLRLALTCGPEEVLLASFDPIADVRVGSAPRPRRVPLAVGSPGRSGPVPAPAGHPGEDGEHTHRRGDPGSEPTRARLPEAGAAAAAVVLLSVDGAPQGQRVLDEHAPVVTVGRGAGAALRCPDDLIEVSRTHAELTLAHGRVYVEDLHSANGTWLQRRDAEPIALAAGTSEAMEPGDVVWLDEGRQTTVTLL